MQASWAYTAHGLPQTLKSSLLKPIVMEDFYFEVSAMLLPLPLQSNTRI